MASQFMHMLNPYCGVDRDPRGVVRLTICNAGSLNILGSAAINGVREGLEALATEPQIRWLVMTAENIDAATALAWGLVDVVAPEGGLDAAVERTAAALLECGPEALRAQKALLRQWEELPLKQSVDLSIGVFGQSFLTGEP